MFARGPAVAVLILLDSEGKTYAVLTEQVGHDFGVLRSFGVAYVHVRKLLS